MSADAPERAAEYLWQRDQCRSKCLRLERENKRLHELLVYAEAAIKGEYELRIAERRV